MRKLILEVLAFAVIIYFSAAFLVWDLSAAAWPVVLRGVVVVGVLLSSLSLILDRGKP